MFHFIGISDEYDNCPFAANTDQMNNDGDDIGDECDVDDDNDGGFSLLKLIKLMENVIACKVSLNFLNNQQHFKK